MTPNGSSFWNKVLTYSMVFSSSLCQQKQRSRCCIIICDKWSYNAQGSMVCRPHSKASPFPWCNPFDSLYLTSLPGSNITTEDLQAILKSTPVLTELHIQSCVKVSDPIDSPNQIRKSLSSYVPNLKVLVIDKINNILSSRQIIPFLQSYWLRVIGISNSGGDHTHQPQAFFQFCHRVQSDHRSC